jgi:hypothetical protein
MNPGDPIFIFPFEKQIDEIQERILILSTETFLKSWQSHGNPLKAQALIEKKQFLCVFVDEAQALASGCSKDKLYHFVENWMKTENLKPALANQFFIEVQKEIRTFNRSEILLALEKNEISMDSALFPSWLSTRDEFTKLWGQPLSMFRKILWLQEKESNFSR